MRMRALDLEPRCFGEAVCGDGARNANRAPIFGPGGEFYADASLARGFSGVADEGPVVVCLQMYPPPSATRSATADAASASRRRRQEWLLLGVAMLVAAVFVSWGRYAAHRAVDTQERARLEGQARAIDENLSRQLIGAYLALGSVREDHATLWKATELPERASRRLKAMSEAMPGVRTLTLLDADGRALASNRSELIGRDLADREYFQQARARPDPAKLYLSPPFRNVLGVFSINLTIVLPRADGGFGGVVTATLDPDYFSVALHSGLYAPDMWAAIAHSDGAVMLYEPPNPAAAGMNLNRPGSFFRRHLDAGQAASLMTGTVLATGESRLMAQRTVRPAALPLDKALVVAISREQGALFAPWRQQTMLYGLVYALFAATLAAALALNQRRRQALEQLAAERDALQRASAERLELALRGADLGLWDLHVPSGHATVSGRWNSMLGLPHEPADPDSNLWKSRVHPDDWPRVNAEQQAHLAGQTERFESVYRMRHADGHWIWLLDRGQVLERDAQGAPLRMVGTHMDISERMQEQQALQRSEESLAITLNSIGDAVIATDPQGLVVRLNAAAQRLTGWPENEAIGRPLSEVFRIFNARSGEPAVDPVQQVLSSGMVIGLANDTLLVARDGSEYQIADSAAPIRTAAGSIVGVVLTFSDVTERYRVQQVLRSNEQRLRMLLENLHSGVVVHGLDTAVEEANAAACRILGLTIEQMRGRAAVDPHWTFLEEDGSPMALERYPVNQVIASGRSLRNFMAGIRRPDLERPVWGLCNAFALHDDEGALHQVVVTISDITERKLAEEELRLLGAAVARLNDVIMITEAEPLQEPGPRMLFVNEAFERLTGWPREEALGLSPRILQGEQTDRAELARIGAALRRHEPVHAELVNYMRQGRPYWVEIDILPLTDMHGRVTHLVSIERDITERKQAEQRILAARAELQATLEAVPDLLFDLDLHGRFLGFHSPRHDLLYTDPQQFLGRTVAEVLPAEAAEVVAIALQQANERRPVDRRCSTNSTCRRRRCWFELSVARKPQPAGEVPRFVVLARDITERKQAEVERQRARSASCASRRRWRRSARWPAASRTTSTTSSPPSSATWHWRARTPATATRRLPAWTRSARPACARATWCSRSSPSAAASSRACRRRRCARWWRRRSACCAPPCRPACAWTACCADVAVLVRADATQLQQVLINLCTNAWHALPERGGRIEVGFERVALDDALRERLPELSAPGLCAPLGARQRFGHGRGHARTHLRPVLHHQAGRPGHRARPVGGARHRAGARRFHRGGHRAGAGHAVPPLPALAGVRRGGARCVAGAGGRASRRRAARALHRRRRSDAGDGGAAAAARRLSRQHGVRCRGGPGRRACEPAVLRRWWSPTTTCRSCRASRWRAPSRSCGPSCRWSSAPATCRTNCASRRASSARAAC